MVGSPKVNLSQPLGHGMDSTHGGGADDGALALDGEPAFRRGGVSTFWGVSGGSCTHSTSLARRWG